MSRNSFNNVRLQLENLCKLLNEPTNSTEAVVLGKSYYITLDVYGAGGRIEKINIADYSETPAFGFTNERKSSKELSKEICSLVAYTLWLQDVKKLEMWDSYEERLIKSGQAKKGYWRQEDTEEVLILTPNN